MPDHNPAYWEAAHVPGDLLFKGLPGTKLSDFAGILDRHGAILHDRAHLISPIQVAWVSGADDSESLAKDLYATGLIEYAEPNHIQQNAAFTNDPGYPGNAGIGGVTQWYLTKMDFPSAWAITTGSSAVTVAVLGSGLDPAHPDFDYVNRVVTGYNVIADNTDTTDTFGHETKVSGPFAATNNSTGIAGADQACKIMPILMATSGSLSVSNLVAAINKAVALGPDILNISWGLSARNYSTVQTALRAAWQAGKLTVAATGDYTSGAYFLVTPAALQNVIPIFGTDVNDAATSYAFQVDYTLGPSTINLACPGGDSPSPSNFLTTCLVSAGTYTSSFIGSSFAAPLASAVLSLMKAANPSANQFQLLQTIFDPANSDATTGFTYATKRLNAGKCVTAIQAVPAYTFPKFFFYPGIAA